MNELEPTEVSKSKDDIAIVVAFGAAVAAATAGWLYALRRLLVAMVAQLF